MSDEKVNAFLDGNFAPVSEEVECRDLQVEGTIPEALQGYFVRNGPNPRFVYDQAKYHWFDGDGMLHAVELNEGKVHYRNRFVRTRGFELEGQEGRALWKGFTSGPDPSNPHGLTKNVANTAIIRHAGRVLCLWEGGEPHEVRLDDLTTVGLAKFGGETLSPFSAHPKIDPRTGEMVAFGYSFIQPPHCRVYFIDAEGKHVRTEPIDLPVPIMMHDCAITANYVVLLDMPLNFRFERMAQGKSPLAFEETAPARIGLLPRAGGSVRWFDTKPGAVIHTINAFEQGSEVVLWACRSERTSLVTTDMKDGDRAHPYEWVIDVERGTVAERQIDNLPSDFPRINENYTGVAQRFAYMSGFASSTLPEFDSVAKVDRQTGAVVKHEFGPRVFGGDTAFAPRPGATEEDDGWLLAMVHDQQHNQSSLLVIDARDFAAPPVAKVKLPVRVPYGFHAAWFAN